MVQPNGESHPFFGKVGLKFEENEQETFRTDSCSSYGCLAIHTLLWIVLSYRLLRLSQASVL